MSHYRIIEIKDLKDKSYQEQLKMYDGLKENQLFHYYEPDLGIFIAESPKVIMRALDDGYQPISFLTARNYLNQEAMDVLERESMRLLTEEVNVYVCEPALYSQVTGLGMTRGMICAMRRKELPEPADLLKRLETSASSKDRERVRVNRRIAVLDDVENPTNVGAIFRSAAALFMDAVILTSTCSDPLYRRAARVSMGTVFQIPWTYFKGYTPSKDYYALVNVEDGEKGKASYHYIDELHRLGYKVCAMALSDHSIPIHDQRLKEEERLAVILGNEGVGLPDSTLKQCDYIVKIPMSHQVDSLNVAAASAVAFYALTL